MLPPQETRVPSLVWELRFPTPAYHAAPMGENNSIAAISNSFLKGEINFMGFPGSSEGKESACNAEDPGLIPRLGRFPWRRELQLIPVFLPGEFHGQRSLGGL